MIDLSAPETRRNPYPLYARLRAAAPVLRDPRSGAWLLLDYESVKRALTDHATFSSDVSNAGFGNLGWLIFADPPRHTKLRALVMRAFTPRAVAALEPRVREIARGLLDRTAGRGEMELVADFSVPLPLMVIAELLGAPVTDWPRFRAWSDAAMGLANTVAPGPDVQATLARFGAAHAEMREYLAPLLARRRAAPEDDLLTRLTAAEVDGEWLTDDEILAFFQLLLLAGHETTTNLLDNAVLAFHEHPDQLARLRAAPQLVPSAIEEVLRYRSPVQASFRVALRDVELHGQTIPARSLVLAMIGAANRDPRQFADAERFDVAREPNLHVAFGHGIHFCVGAPLARLEARVALPMLLEHLGDFAPAEGDGWEPRAAFHVHGPSRLPLRFAPARRAPEAARAGARPQR